MSFGQTALGMLALSGLMTLAIQVSVPEPPSARLPPAIRINEITIRDDETTVYDRVILDGPVWQAWAGVIYDLDGGIHCEGGDLAKYNGPLDDPTGYDVHWLVGDDCTGLDAGMTFYFTWTPMGPDYSPVRYPDDGFGVVVPASEKEE